MSRDAAVSSPQKRRAPQVAGMARALPRQRVPNLTVKQYEEPPMPKEQRERLEELAEVVKDMALSRAEDERERRREEAQRKREVSSLRRRIQRELRKSSREVRSRETETAELRREVVTLEREEETLISRKLRRDEKFEEGFAKVKSKEIEKNHQRLNKRTETEGSFEKLSHLKAALRNLEVNQMRAITADAPDRGARTRSSSRATQLELEVEELCKESDRLDEENAQLRKELESFQSPFPSWQAAPESRTTGAEALEASRRGVMASPGRVASRQKDEPARSPAKVISAIDASDSMAELSEGNSVFASGTFQAQSPLSSSSNFQPAPVRSSIRGRQYSLPQQPVEALSSTAPIAAEGSLGTLQSSLLRGRQQSLPQQPLEAWKWSAPTPVELRAAHTSAEASFITRSPTAASPSSGALPMRLATPNSALRAASGSPLRPFVGHALGSPVATPVPTPAAPPRRIAAVSSTAPLSGSLQGGTSQWPSSPYAVAPSPALGGTSQWPSSPSPALGGTSQWPSSPYAVAPSPALGPRASPQRLATTSPPPVGSPLMASSSALAPPPVASRLATARSHSSRGFAAAVHLMKAQALHDYRLAHTGGAAMDARS